MTLVQEKNHKILIDLERQFHLARTLDFERYYPILENSLYDDVLNLYLVTKSVITSVIKRAKLGAPYKKRTTYEFSCHYTQRDALIILNTHFPILLFKKEFKDLVLASNKHVFFLITCNDITISDAKKTFTMTTWIDFPKSKTQVYITHFSNKDYLAIISYLESIYRSYSSQFKTKLS